MSDLYPLGLFTQFMAAAGFVAVPTVGEWEEARWRGTIPGIGERLVIAYARKRNMDGQPIKHNEDPNRHLRVVIAQPGSGAGTDREEKSLWRGYSTWRAATRPRVRLTAAQKEARP